MGKEHKMPVGCVIITHTHLKMAISITNVHGNISAKDVQEHTKHTCDVFRDYENSALSRDACSLRLKMR